MYPRNIYSKTINGLEYRIVEISKNNFKVEKQAKKDHMNVYGFIEIDDCKDIMHIYELCIASFFY